MSWANRNDFCQSCWSKSRYETVNKYLRLFQFFAAFSSHSTISQYTFRFCSFSFGLAIDSDSVNVNKTFKLIFSFQLLLCDTTQSVVSPWQVAYLYVCDHIGWNSFEIISWVVSLECSLSTTSRTTPTSWITSNGTWSPSHIMGTKHKHKMHSSWYVEFWMAIHSQWVICSNSCLVF